MFFFFPFLIVCGLLLTAALVKPVRIYQYPYFMAATFVVFVAPQLYGLYWLDWASSFVPATALMSLLCLGSCWLGYLPKADPAIIEKLNVSLNPTRFLHGGIVLVIIGFYFTYKFRSLSEDAISTMMTGIGTIYLFFSALVYPGFAICFYCALKHRNPFAWLAATIAASIPIQTAIFYGRREPTVLFVLSFVMSFYFIKGKTPPRWAIVAAIVAAIFVIPAIGQYRNMSAEDPLEAFKSIDFKQELSQYFDGDGVSEMKNATVLIAATRQTGDYEWGAGYWNQLVFRFIPAQLLGESFKAALMLGGGQRDLGAFVEDSLGISIPVGSTLTGLGDSFNQFGFFGCLVFAGIGYLFKNLWAAADHLDGTSAQILYIQVMTSAMRSITHQTLDFLPGLLYSGIFIALVVFYAKEREGFREHPALRSYAERAHQSGNDDKPSND